MFQIHGPQYKYGIAYRRRRRSLKRKSLRLWRGGAKAKAEEKEAKEKRDKANNLKKELVLDQQHKIPLEELLARTQ